MLLLFLRKNLLSTNFIVSLPLIYKFLKLMAILYSRNEEITNYLSHAAGVVLGLVAGILLLQLTYDTHNTWGTIGVIIYMFGILSSYGASTAYHACKPGPRKALLRKFDHAAIYLHIAGSYSPITLTVLRDQGYWGWALFVFIWLCALVGVILSFWKLKEHSNLETICFVTMGASIFMVFKPLLDCTDWSVILWLIGEGFFYITGAVFYSFKKLPYMHSVFHFFCLGGSICHIIAVWLVLSSYS